MFDILYRSLILILIIVLGYGLKRAGLFSRERDFQTISALVLYLTLPNAIITNLNGLRFPPILLVISVLGFLTNWIFIGLGHQFGRDKEEKSFMMLNINGFNIGNFALPFIAFFLEGLPILAISLFDAGSSIMALGGNYILAENVKGEEAEIGLSDLLKTIAKSPAILVYVVMVSLSLLNIDLPNTIIDIAAIIGSANTFLAMFLIGMVLELKINRAQLQKLGKYISIRYVTVIILAIALQFAPILSSPIKQALSLLLLAPVAGSAPIFTERIDGDVELSAQVNSISIIMSIIIMSTILVFIGA